MNSVQNDSEFKEWLENQPIELLLQDEETIMKNYETHLEEKYGDSEEE